MKIQLRRIREKLAVTQGSAFALTVPVMNLEKLQESHCVIVAFLVQHLIGNAAFEETTFDSWPIIRLPSDHH
jgi:hypothetical protein